MLIRDMPISSLTTDADDEESEEIVLILWRCSPFNLSFVSGNLLGLASRSAFSRSRSTISIAFWSLLGRKRKAMKRVFYYFSVVSQASWAAAREVENMICIKRP